VICGSVVWCYDKGSKGVKIFETLLKIMVAIIVISFFGVVVKMSFSEEPLQWGKVLAGFIPDFKLLSAPADTFYPFISAVDTKFQDFWRGMIVAQQRDVMITAAATAVGINMTFLLPYSMLKRGWDKNFRGLAIFDLSTGMFIPFVLATGCVVIASASQFHTQAAAGFLGETDATGALIEPAGNLIGEYNKLAGARLQYEIGDTAFGGLTDELKKQGVKALPEADKRMCAMLIKRDAFNLADSLAPLTGSKFSQYVFGVGVVGMAISSVIILMLINGFVVCEIFNLPMQGWPYRIGCLMPGIGILGPFFWTKAAFWLAVPTSVFGMVLLPIAYFTFFLL
ncbi:MAG: divalent metal cation transporter, partial [Planctomycetes bacterium]|nr:divalent metal cation transporter [Planctomycetota bacterium]